MKHYYWIILSAVLLFFGCENKKEKEARLYLKVARSAFYEHEYTKAQKMADSIPSLFPGAYEQIRAAGLLSDSIIREFSRLRIDSISDEINYYERRAGLHQSDDLALRGKIDSLGRLIQYSQAVIREIDRKEILRLSCTQCRTALKRN